MCTHESGNKWLRPRNGSDMIHRHFPVSSRHSAVEANRECYGYSSIRARSVAFFRVCAIPMKGETFTQLELACSKRTPRIATLFLRDEWSSLLRHCANTLEQVFYSSLTNETRSAMLKTADCRLTYHELCSANKLRDILARIFSDTSDVTSSRGNLIIQI